MSITESEELARRLAQLESAVLCAQRDVENLEAGIRKTQRSSAASKLFALAATFIAGVSTISTITIAQGSGQRVTAPFIVVNDEGKEIAGIRESANGGIVEVSNSSGKSVASIWSDNSGLGNLTVSNGQGEQRFRVFIDDRDGGGMGIWGRNGELAADLMEGDTGARGMFIYNRDGKAVVRLLAVPDGGGQITAGEAKKQSGILTSDTSNSIRLVDTEGKKVWMLTNSGRSGRRGFWLFDEQETAVAGAVVDKPGSAKIGVRGNGDFFGAALTSDDGGAIAAGFRDTGTPRFEATKDGAYIYNDAGANEIALTYSNQGGIFAIGDSAGNTMVDAGVLNNGRGVVRTYPLGGATPIPIPHFIEGWGGPH